MDDPTPTIDASSKPLHRFRRTRTAVSVFFVVLTMALCVMWVRSYGRADVISRSIAGGTYTEVKSVVGLIDASVSTSPNQLPNAWSYRSSTLSALYPRSSFFRFGWYSRKSISKIYFPHWFPVLVTAALSALCWSPASPGFSLRSMLIATTLIAVVLGLGVWLSG